MFSLKYKSISFVFLPSPLLVQLIESLLAPHVTIVRELVCYSQSEELCPFSINCRQILIQLNWSIIKEIHRRLTIGRCSVSSEIWKIVFNF